MSRSEPSPQQTEKPLSAHGESSNQEGGISPKRGDLKLIGHTDAKTEKRIVFYVLVGLIIFALLYIFSFYR